MTGKMSTNDSNEHERESHQPTKSPSPLPKGYGPRTPMSSPPPSSQGLRSPPSDTQPYSQYITPAPYSYEVQDEKDEGVWGYLVPLDGGPSNQKTLVMKRRATCPLPAPDAVYSDGKQQVGKMEYVEQEEKYEKAKRERGTPAGGYLIGRHPECGTSTCRLKNIWSY